ncbi:C40 family peptidase [Streptomyces alkaliphilus]|uniref:Transglycosylase SLT domain-containing protein n=1 Tax=Streptomyces alkaliphilus TaxID=1472722 RepID=A0A7W3Y1J0_9ACTN|nr:bifunctional lytic transglycosylase/C40 family peptidase [Streptomyces alkaliphilus]MBB0244558.1 transglycosylase SLT domain-containing protein [Streptomyces alkaliphilus]MQS08861.1 transglycosylase SLT domain-containing protein [Streptomyces alkaliphilus]
MRKALLWSGIGFGGLCAFMALLVIGVFAAAGGGGVGGSGSGRLAQNSVPVEYEPLVSRWGNLCPELSPALLAAQLQQESGWQPTAQSHARAQGIAQFIPETWASHGIDGNGDGRIDVWDPEDAIPSAAAYNCAMAQYVRDVPGDPVDNMLASYNAGPYAVIRYQGIPPYAETQHYVKTIRAMEESFAAPVVEERLPPSEAAAGAVHFAQSHLGTPYLWGGDGTPEDDGRFDCSGLTRAAFESVGIELPRVANDQWHSGPHPSRDELLPGDLVFFATDLTDSRSINHVGIYVGGGYMINAPYTGAVIRFDPIDSPDYFGATRPVAA